MLDSHISIDFKESYLFNALLRLRESYSDEVIY